MRFLRPVAYAALGALALFPIALVGLVHALTAPAPATVKAPEDLPVTRFTLTPSGGVNVQGWFVAGAPERGGVLLLHGVRANRLAMIARMRFLNAAGYSVAAIDFRAHGESTGDKITFGRDESADAAAALSYMREKLPGRKIAVIGQSLGGAAALLGQGPITADAFVLESVYPDIDRAIDDRLTAPLGPLGHLVTPALLVVGRTMTGLDPEFLRPIDRIEKIRAPVFVISGVRDPNTHIDEARELFARAPKPKAFWAVEGVGHEDIYFRTNAEYRERILSFFGEHL
ncbi:esterase (plasmid) [Methylosinus sp. C49]|uniref:alpha/beta hydrolase n=1 Tax=Methylosinus sp. C49 TaxID=2699395 RepID=UPI001366A682|nr:alpha/beta fold hydrolase [Methylosinus sp. C49]BBU64076.1 esterase [Methylosinus sp. C49]